jgi:hypothetical protein
MAAMAAIPKIPRKTPTRRAVRMRPGFGRWPTSITKTRTPPHGDEPTREAAMAAFAGRAGMSAMGATWKSLAPCEVYRF